MQDQQLTSGESRSVSVFDRSIEAGDREKLSRGLLESMAQRPISVFFCNVHMLMLSQEDQVLAQAMDAADRVIPDGVPISWLQKRLGHQEADVLRGYEALQAVCEVAVEAGQSIGFLGSTDEVLKALKDNLTDEYPGLLVPYLFSPPQLSETIEVDTALVEAINSQHLHCLFIGLGCPKQEKWVAAYAPELNCSLFAVGAAFDWLAGTTSMPPRWMENNGLGWLHRLFQNPRRMWHRYLIYNSKFMVKSIRVPTQGSHKQ